MKLPGTQALVLMCLTLQNTTLILSIKASRNTHGPSYIASSAVLATEILKFIISILSHIYYSLYDTNPSATSPSLPSLQSPHSSKNEPLWNRITAALSVIFDKKKLPIILRLLIPSLLYAMQNNLLYVAISNLEAVTFQVTYQLKTLTTAFFASKMLGKRLDSQKWIALGLLTLGVAAVQMPSGAAAAAMSSAPISGNRILGLAAVITACISSGFSGVYLEKFCKNSGLGFWQQNAYLSGSSLPLAFFTVLAGDSARVRDEGMFVGFTPLVLSIVANQAVGGFLVAAVMKLADNITKCFAVAVSIIVSGLLSVYLFLFAPAPTFVFGTALVVSSIFLYGDAIKLPLGKADLVSSPTPKTPISPSASASSIKPKSMSIPFQDERAAISSSSLDLSYVPRYRTSIAGSSNDLQQITSVERDYEDEKSPGLKV